MRKILIGSGIIIVLALLITISSGLFTNTNEVESDKTTSDIGLTQTEVEEGLNLQENGADGTYVVNLIAGAFDGDVEGVVLSDTDCEADEEGISRCHNDIELEDETISIVNPHNMQKNRCLRPGETVRLAKNEDGKVTVELLES
ncbi:hypothetical protein [Oceanobacillus halotolerans]|uniref:hypothetical protein n=1 Tax=Oceanobacillus halotolerans TaxID=2663380 RepID=UPI0013D994AF|nr:hypothetical protein [Oceanobacillus halotolerans]